MSVIDFMKCDCDCHQFMFKGTMMHVMPCCHICSRCGSRIKAEIFADHERDCIAIAKTLSDLITDEMLGEINQHNWDKFCEEI